MAVSLLLHFWLLFLQDVQCQAAVASLVGTGHIQQRDTERLGLGSVQHRVVVLRVKAIVTPLVHVWRKEPGMMPSVRRVLQSARLFTHHRDVGTLGAHVVDVGHRDTERVGMVLSVTWRKKTK